MFAVEEGCASHSVCNYGPPPLFQGHPCLQKRAITMELRPQGDHARNLNGRLLAGVRLQIIACLTAV